jgi:alkylation response protein AidB-like acyl-CoA dehydrogenase
MSTAAHYRSNLRDIYFNLFEVLRVQDATFGRGPYAGFDEDTARAALGGLEEFVQASFANSFVAGDRQGARFDGAGNVTLPAEVTASLRAYYEGGWHNLELPEALGGMGAPPSVGWAGFELLAGSHAAATFYLLGNLVAKVIDRLGTPGQRARFVENMVKGHWGATMVLTEPDAGSDVGAGTTRARHVAGDEYLLEGTSASSPTATSTCRPTSSTWCWPGPRAAARHQGPVDVHRAQVLGRGRRIARRAQRHRGHQHRAQDGHQGVGDLRADARRRYAVPGPPGRRQVHDGIAQMFQVIEYARMGVGTKSMATCRPRTSTRSRTPGPQAGRRPGPRRRQDRAAGRDHPPPRRAPHAHAAEAAWPRACARWCCGPPACRTRSCWPAATWRRGRRRGRSTPATTCCCRSSRATASEKVYELLAVSLQCFGGSGYCQDYPIEQYIRDQKIDSLYEGTTHIQALDLFFRKVGRDRGATLRRLMARARGDAAPA